jgi:hypothetical protein
MSWMSQPWISGSSNHGEAAVGGRCGIVLEVRKGPSFELREMTKAKLEKVKFDFQAPSPAWPEWV